MKAVSLWCEGKCGGYSEHVFSRPEPVLVEGKVDAVNVMYRCSTCGTERQYGYERPEYWNLLAATAA